MTKTAARAYPGNPQIAYCAMTFEDAMTWDAARLERETQALCRFMSEHWTTLDAVNQESLLKEKRALRMATLARMAAA